MVWILWGGLNTVSSRSCRLFLLEYKGHLQSLLYNLH